MIDPILRQYWPPENHILLLKFVFAGDEEAKRAWNEWSARSSLDRASWEEVRLLATAARRMRDLDPGSSLSRRLDGVRRFVWTNTQMTLNGTRPLLAKFCESNVRLMLIKGAARLALAPQLAADRLLRDIDVLVHPDDWSKALELADQNGWRDPRWPNLTTEIFPYHHGVGDFRTIAAARSIYIILLSTLAGTPVMMTPCGSGRGQWRFVVSKCLRRRRPTKFSSQLCMDCCTPAELTQTRIGFWILFL